MATIEVNQKENQLHLYSINENEFIGEVDAFIDDSDTNIQIVILDHSSAVGNAAARLVKEVVPLVMSKVKNWFSSVQLITFGEESVHKYLSKTDLSNFNLKSGGAANIGPAIEKLRLYFERFSKNTSHSFDVLTISAGEISDRENAEQEAKKLIDFLATIDGWKINSQAVRLSTASNSHQPDTKALSYLLRINNTTAANICDIDVTSSNETIANGIAALFPENVSLCTGLCVDAPIILDFPWKSFPLHLFAITSGWNIFWLKQQPPTDGIRLQGKPINVVTEGQLNLEKFQQLMEKKLPQMVAHMKILKIVGTTEANEIVDQIFSYFAKTEDALAVKCSTPNNKIITNALAGIAMYRPDFRDSAEMIEFYRDPTKAIEDQIETDLLKKEEEELRKQKEEERKKQEEEERLKREEEDRLRREEEATADPNNNPTSVQTIFILDENSSEENATRNFMKEIIPRMLSKHFHESLQANYQVTFVRYKSSATETLQSLVEALDSTKRIQISILTNGEVQEMENFAKIVIEFLNGTGYAFDLQVVRLASTSPTKKRYKLVDINANESNELIAEQIVSECCFNGKAHASPAVGSAGIINNWIFYLIGFVVFYYYFYFY